jgi:DNA-binding CsgD family transcriptional regulator
MDWIDLVEPIYDLETPSHDAWLGTIVERVGPFLGRSDRVLGAVFHLEGDRLNVLGVRNNELPYADRTRKFSAARPDLVLRAYRGRAFDTMSSHVGRATFRGAREYQEIFASHGDRDVLGLLARDGGAWGVCLAAGVAKVRSVTRAESAPWERIAAHVHAALRLRFRLHGVPAVHPSPQAVDLSLGIDAVVSPSGRVEHAEHQAQGSLHALRQAAISIDRARARMRREDPEGALDAWRSLVEGEWSLIETFESDGRRFMVARRNAPDAPRAPLLSRRERQVLGFYGRAHGVKLIAYEMGLSAASVSRALRSAKEKLGIASPAQVAQLFQGAGA